MRSEAFEAQKTHLGCRYEQREYERGPHARGAREQVGLVALRPVVQREWHSASQHGPLRPAQLMLGGKERKKAEAPAAGQHNKISSHRRWSHTKELATSWHGRPLY
jgi:hypothetical protein